MSRTKDEDIEKWIDLSVLPVKYKKGGKDCIDWIGAIGIPIPFIYGEISGNIIITKATINSNDLWVHVDGYTFDDDYKICKNSFKNMYFSSLLTEKIATSHPELIKYFVDEQDAYRYSAGSNVKVYLRCPDCGTIKLQTIYSLVHNGLACSACSDGISWAEKFMYNILMQLNVNFTKQVSKSTPGFDWIIKGYKYDFYFEINNNKYFVELDGQFHNKDAYRSYQSIKEADKEKDFLADMHGITMIRIDCDYSEISNRFLFIKSNILNSELGKILNLQLVDWDDANRTALGSNIILAAQLWNAHVSISKMSTQIDAKITTIRNYLKIAADLNLCDYNVQESIERRSKNVASAARKSLSKHIALYKDTVLQGVFYNALELEQKSYELYGIRLLGSKIQSVCLEKRAHHHGYTAMYISHQEYEQLSCMFPEKQNERDNLQEVI